MLKSAHRIDSYGQLARWKEYWHLSGIQNAVMTIRKGSVISGKPRAHGLLFDSEAWTMFNGFGSKQMIAGPNRKSAGEFMGHSSFG